MLRRVVPATAFVLTACGAPEPPAPPPEAVRAHVEALAEIIGESADALSNDPCVIGCAGAAASGCSTVQGICDDSYVFSYGGAYITCTEAILAACGSTVGLYDCAVSCRARAGRN